MAARLAVDSMPDRVLEKMELSIREQEKLVAEENLVGYSRSDFEFHAFVYAACGNTVLKEMLESLKNKARPLTMRITPILPELSRITGHLEGASATGPELAKRRSGNTTVKVLALCCLRNRKRRKRRKSNNL
jgi:DNA-binding GntR family transcriptional regulator